MCLPDYDYDYENVLRTGALSRSSIIGEAKKGRLRWSREDQELHVCLVLYLF